MGGGEALLLAFTLVEVLKPSPGPHIEQRRLTPTHGAR